MRLTNQPAVIAIVDDDAPLRGALDNLIRSCGFRALQFDSAEAFLDLPQCERIDVVITDFGMPGMTGLDLLRALKGRGESPPAILISAHADDELLAQATALGAVACLRKPFEDEELLLEINRAMGVAAEQS